MIELQFNWRIKFCQPKPCMKRDENTQSSIEISNHRIEAWWSILGKDCTRWWKTWGVATFIMTMTVLKSVSSFVSCLYCEMNFMGQQDCGISIEFYLQQTWNPHLGGLMYYSFSRRIRYKEVYGGRRLGRIGSCRGEMLLSTSAKWLLIWTYPVIRNHEGKKFYNFLAHLKR